MTYSRTGLGFACPPPLVWAATYSRCMNADDPRVANQRPAAGQSAAPDPRAPLADAGEIMASAAQQGVSFAQVPLSAEARAYFAQRGVPVDCKIDDYWFVGPQGGDPSRLCSVNGSPYEHAAYTLNINPSIALPDALRGPVQTSAVPAASSYSPTPSANYTPAPATPSGAGQQPAAQPSGPAPAPASPYTFTPPELPAVLTEEFITGVPNWALAAVGAFVVYKTL